QSSPSPAQMGSDSPESVAQTDLEPKGEKLPPSTDQLETTKVFQPSNPSEADTAFADTPAAAYTDSEADTNVTQTPLPNAIRSPGVDAGPVSGLNKGSAAGKTAVLGDFRLVKKLGVGGMGQVFKGRQISLDRDVAVKVLSKQLAGNPAFVQRFYREARIMARLDHPHIVRCYGVGEAFGWHYVAMEYLDGGSMQDQLKKLGKLSLGDALHVILACAHALQHAHELEMIHRDIKPDNILLTGKGVVKVADLGLAKALSEELNL